MTGGVLALLVCTSAQAGSLGKRLDTLIDEPAWRGATIGIDVRDATTGERLYSRDAASLVTPASTTKWVTALAAAETLGLDYRFETTVVRTGEIVDGVLHGDIGIVGTGDPTLGRSDPAGLMDDWARAVREAGITRVDGRVVTDASALGDPLLGSGWAWDDAPYRFSAPMAAVNLGRNLMTVVAHGEGEGRVDAGPLTPCLDVDVALEVGKGASGIAILREPWRQRWVVVGRVPQGGTTRKTTPLRDPNRCAAAMLDAALERAGVTVDADPDVGPVEPVAVVATQQSAPLSDILQITLKASDNLYAEAVARALDPAETGRTYAGARTVIADMLARARVAPEAYKLVDGSGLSRYDLLAAESLVTVSMWARTQPWYPQLAAMLPVAGVDGTLASRMTDGPAKQRVRAKTGSMSGVRNLVGYVEDADGRQLVVAILIVGFTQSQAEAVALQDALLQRIAASSRGRLSKRTARALDG